tara:strand:- start:188 stop:427 length:240 start_codon:yes stop_codon:yes gene_type:complete
MVKNTAKGIKIIINLFVDKYSFNIISSFLDLKDTTNKIIESRKIIDGIVEIIWKVLIRLKFKIEKKDNSSPKLPNNEKI